MNNFLCSSYKIILGHFYKIVFIIILPFQVFCFYIKQYTYHRLWPKKQLNFSFSFCLKNRSEEWLCVYDYLGTFSRNKIEQVYSKFFWIFKSKYSILKHLTKDSRLWNLSSILGGFFNVEKQDIVFQIIVRSPLGLNGPIAAITITLAPDQVKNVSAFNRPIFMFSFIFPFFSLYF